MDNTIDYTMKVWRPTPYRYATSYRPIMQLVNFLITTIKYEFSAILTVLMDIECNFYGSYL